MNELFAIQNASVEYATEQQEVTCELLDCMSNGCCLCSACLCCSTCTEGCQCPEAEENLNSKVACILKLGDKNYR